jgi:hypothetical protein
MTPILNNLCKENNMWTRAAQVLMLAAVVVAQPAPDNGSAQAAQVAAQPTSSGTANAQTPRPGMPLGDLSTFRAIAVDTLKIVKTGDLGAAKKRIKDLELSWDQAEPRMKPLAPQKWETVDVAIDRALKEVRAWRATQEKCSEALQALISTIDSIK